jgi:heat shock protein HslJ
MKSINLRFIAIVFLFLGCKKESDAIISEPRDLKNTKWSINESKEIPRNIAKNSELPIIWLGEEYFRVTTGCNIITGLLKISDKTIGFTDYTTTLANCEGYLTMEVYLMQNLRKITSYKYTSGILYLYIGTEMIGSFKRVNDK